MLAAIIRLSVRRPRIVVARAMLLLLYGGFLLSQASLDIFPEFSPKRVIIQTESPGLSSEQVEMLVTQPLEKRLAGMVGVASIRSESIQGLSIVTLIFDDRSDLYRNRQLVGERLDGLASQLPPGVGPPVAVPLSSSSATVLTIGLQSRSRSPMELRGLADWTVAPRLLAVPGVADVNVFGGDVKQLQIQPDPDALRRHGLGIEQVIQAAQQAVGMRGAGFVETRNQRITLQVSGLPRAPDTLERVVVSRKDGSNVLLGDVAVIRVAPEAPISAAAVMGEPAVLMMVIAQYGANTLQVSRDVESVLREFERRFASDDIQLHPRLFRPADYIERSVQNLGGHVLIGGLFVILVLYAFLFSLRTALIPALAIPLSLLGAVAVLRAFGVNLNVMVLGGLAIALGEVVDDAIIDTENIFRRLRENASSTTPRPPHRVIFDAALEVRGSVVYASFIVALVFAPLLALGGIAGRLFSPLAHAYILAILASLLVALTVTPALCCLLLEKGMAHTGTPPLIRWLAPRYARLLQWSMKAPVIAVLMGLLVCGTGLAMLPGMGGQFLPELREGHYIVHTSSLPGTSLWESLRIGTRLTAAFLDIPGVQSVSQWAGRAERGADTYGSHYSEYEVRLAPLSGKNQQRVQDRLREILKEFPGIAYEANTFLIERVDETISGYTSPVVVNLYGRDLALLDEKAQDVANLMQRIAGATDIQLRSPPGTPLLRIELRLDQLASFGLRPLDVADAVQAAYGGKVVGRFPEGDRTFDVAVILGEDQRRQLEKVALLPLRTPEGTIVGLEQAADIQLRAGRYNILHRGTQRVQTVTCSVSGRDLASFSQELQKRMMTELDLPSELYPELTGAAIEQAKTRGQLFVHAALAGAGVLLLIYAALGSVRHTLLTLSNLPFALVGGIAAAWLGGGVLSVGSLVGFVTLFGITVRNAIMLIAHYRHLVNREGRRWTSDTAVQGAQDRLPSILMTALVTALAMLPIAIGSDNPGREIMGPMAAIIIGGLVSSTALNLLLLPTLLLRYGRFEGIDSVDARSRRS
jgi:CzcA family heavy metal efflux pump